MLNRRSLRIKVMQSLFALQQCKEACYELGMEQIAAAFAPDLNSMEVQDKPQLNLQKKEAIKTYEKAFAAGEFTVDHEDQRIKKSVSSAFQYYQTQVKKDSDFFRKNLVSEVEKIYDHYISTLSLIAAFADLAEADKKLSHKNFSANAWVKALQNSELLKKKR
jgi:N utilization substance protein B